MGELKFLDKRIVYGAQCTWWDSIDKISKHHSGLPCCPHCSGMLFEMANQKEWFVGVDKYEALGNPGYRAMVEWSRGRCFKHPGALIKAYRERER